MDLTFKHQPQKMVKHTQTIRRKQPTNCLSVFHHTEGLTFKRLKVFVEFTFPVNWNELPTSDIPIRILETTPNGHKT